MGARAPWIWSRTKKADAGVAVGRELEVVVTR